MEIMNLKLERPIVFFDLEATGINVMRDRIVEICVVKVLPDGEKEIKKRLINPEIPIPPQATEIHGITDEDVKNEPTFRQVSKSFFDFLGSCDLSGFNLLKYDIPLLMQEFKRANLMFETRERKVVDVQTSQARGRLRRHDERIVPVLAPDRRTRGLRTLRCERAAGVSDQSRRRTIRLRPTPSSLAVSAANRDTSFASRPASG